MFCRQLNCVFRVGVRNHLSSTSLRDVNGRRKLTLKNIDSTRQSCPGSANMAKIIAIEGNIGVGKTTLAYKLGNLLGYEVFVEPAAKNPYLARFYADPKKYATKLQLWIFNQRYLIYIAALKHLNLTGQGVILDRSIFSDEVFAQVGHDLGNISENGFLLYNKIRKKVMESLVPPHLYVYLHASPQVCLERIKERGRKYEKQITVEYLSWLDEKYQNFRNCNQNKAVQELYYDWTDIVPADIVARDIKKLNLRFPNTVVTENGMTFSSVIKSELESELSEDEEENNCMQIAERNAFELENSSTS